VATARADRAARPRSWPAVLAWALFALVLLLFATYPLLDRVVRDAGRPDLALFAPFVVAPTLAALTASTVGWVLASRRPRHPVGWLLLTLGLSMAVGGAIAGYLPYTTIVRPDALPAAGLLARIYAPVTDLALASLGLVLLLTPTGSAPSPGWRRWAFASSAAMAALAVAATLAPGSVDARILSIEGPVGPHAFGGTLAVAAVFQPARRRIQGPSTGASTAAATTRPGSSRGRGPSAGGGRPGHPDRRGAGGGRADHAADPGVAVAATTARVGRRLSRAQWRWW
jgi:hypothetical protein